MKPPLPVTLVTGFLGAGKTTLVKRLLAATAGLRVGVILNEFGEAGVDTVPERMRAYLELGGGCACCVANPDLVAALRELGARDDLDRLVVESAGLADPLPLTWTIGRPDLAPFVRLDAVVTVVDAANHAKAARTEWEAQLIPADLVVLSKLDLVSDARRIAAETAIRAVNTAARLLPLDGSWPVELVLDTEPATSRERTAEAPRARHSEFSAVTFETTDTYDRDGIEDVLEALPDAVFRAKGIFRCDGRWLAFHVVGGRVTVEQDVAAPTHGESRFAFFGRSPDAGALRAAIEGARVGGA